MFLVNFLKCYLYQNIFHKQFGIYPVLYCSFMHTFFLVVDDICLIFKQFRLTVIHFHTHFLCQLVNQHTSLLSQRQLQKLRKLIYKWVTNTLGFGLNYFTHLDIWTVQISMEDHFNYILFLQNQ